jgi:hypothetical protein
MNTFFANFTTPCRHALNAQRSSGGGVISATTHWPLMTAIQVTENRPGRDTRDVHDPKETIGDAMRPDIHSIGSGELAAVDVMVEKETDEIGRTGRSRKQNEDGVNLTKIDDGILECGGMSKQMDKARDRETQLSERRVKVRKSQGTPNTNSMQSGESGRFEGRGRWKKVGEVQEA